MLFITCVNQLHICTACLQILYLPLFQTMCVCFFLILSPANCSGCFLMVIIFSLPFFQKLELYAETLKELNEQIRLSEEESTLLQSRVFDLESENKILNEAVTETDLLKVKVESLEAEICDKSYAVTNYESEINMLKEKLEVAENCKISASESERLQHEFEAKVKETEDKLKVVEDEKDALTTALETVRMNKEEVEKVKIISILTRP